jgi:DHA3 family macrolide efflux protein-like MFS transporter
MCPSVRPAAGHSTATWVKLTFIMAQQAFPSIPSSSPKPAFTQKTILRYQPFRTIWLAQFVSIFGDFLALFAVISLITFKLNGNAVQVTAVTIAYVLPLALIGPAAGVFVDHWNVKRVMILSDLTRAVLIIMLVFVTDVAQICAIFAVLSAVSSFFAPAQSVTVRTLVPMDGLLAANAMMTQAFYIVRLASPFAAGALIALVGERFCFWLDAFSFIFSAFMISTLIIRRPARAQSEKSLESLTQDFLEGNKFIFTHAGLAFVFVAMAVAMFVLSSFSPLISIYIRDSLGAGPFTFGFISSMVGIGLIAGSQTLTCGLRAFNRSSEGDDPSSSGTKASPKTDVVLGGLAVLGMGAALLGGFQNIPMAAIATFTMGFAISFVLVPAQTMSQQETPPAMIGRVSSTFMSLISFAQVLGLLLSGYLARALGIRPLFMASAGVLAVIAGVGYWLMRGRILPGQQQEEAQEQEQTVGS